MTQLPVGGPAATTYRVTSRAHVTGRVAVPAYLVTDGRAVEGGPSQQVYYVSDAEIAAGEFVVAGDVHPIPIVAANNVNTEYPPIPIYVVNPPIPAVDLIYDYYVDIDNGNDTTGTGTLVAPWKTLTHAETVAAANKTIGVKGSGTLRETAVIAMKAGQLIAAMLGQSPKISRAILRTGFTLTAGQTITYEISTTDTISTAWQDTSTRLTVRASVALVEANPGSFFKDGAANKLYISCSDSADPATHTIETVAQSLVDGAACIYFGGNNCEIRGLILQHGVNSNVDALSATGCIIRNCILRYGQTGNGYGLRIKAGGSVTSYGSTYTACLSNISNTSATYAGYSDVVSYAVTTPVNTATPVVMSFDNSTFHHNAGGGVPQGVTALTGTITAHDNTGVGIFAPASSSFTPVAYSNTSHGVQSNAATNVTLTTPNIYSNLGAGVTCNAAGLTVNGGTVHNNSGVGIGSTGATLTVTGVTVYANGGAGSPQIELSGNGSAISSNTVTGVAGVNSIQAQNCTSPLIHHNAVSGGIVGIYVQNCVTPKVYNNTSTACVNYGIECEDCTSPEAYSNTVHHNGSIGIICKTAVTGSNYHDNVAHDEGIGLLCKGNDAGSTWANNAATDCTTGLFCNQEPPSQNNANIAVSGCTFTRCTKAYSVQSGQSTGMASDNNSFVTCAQLGDWSDGNTYTTLAQWQTATSLDAHSTES